MPRKTYQQKLDDYQQERQKAIQVADSLSVERLTLAQATALLPRKPEWD